MNETNWDLPYIPPGGIVPECLLPDGCTSCEDPVMRRPLEPLDRFDHPQLKKAEGADPTWDALWSLGLFIAKNCAGLVHEYRPDIAGLRGAFASGQFTKQHHIALEWAFSGMRTKYMFPRLVAGAQLPIFEVARCFWTLFDGASFGSGPWLNQWADDPDKQHPSARVAEVVRAAPELPPEALQTMRPRGSTVTS